MKIFNLYFIVYRVLVVSSLNASYMELPGVSRNKTLELFFLLFLKKLFTLLLVGLEVGGWEIEHYPMPKVLCFGQ